MTDVPVATERLILRPFQESDLEQYTAIVTSEPVRKSLHFPASISRTEAWQQMAAFVGQWHLRGTGQWAVVERASGLLAGRCGLHRPESPDRPGVEVGWALHPAHWGKGYATEAATYWVDHAFDVLRCADVWAFILPENIRSQSVAKRLGFEFVELRTLAFFPEAPHGLWRTTAKRWHARRRSEQAGGPNR